MSSVYYEQLALDWNPGYKDNKLFNVIASTVVIVMVLLGIGVSFINVPEKDRTVRSAVPERIANFIIEKKKPEPKITKPKPKPKPVQKPKPKLKPVVKKSPKTKTDKPLTRTQKNAREKAADSGLLALGNELSDLMATSDVSTMVGGSVKQSTMASAIASVQNKTLLTSGASKGSSGVDAVEYMAAIGQTKLTQREITQVKQSLLSIDYQSKASLAQGKNLRRGGVRAQEDITIIFDQNKSKLYSIYNRARRTNPNLKGKIVIEITISPAGKVTHIRVISSDLKDPKLETRLVNRIKLFSFGAQKVEQVIVTYPIEFLPS